MYEISTRSPMIRRLSDGALIPPDDGNMDFLAYKLWIRAGNTPSTEPEPVLEVPSIVTPLQARKALRAAGIKQAADAFIETLSEEEQEEWAYATQVRRDSPIIAKAAAALGLSDKQLDDLFVLAATLTA